MSSTVASACCNVLACCMHSEEANLVPGRGHPQHSPSLPWFSQYRAHLWTVPGWKPAASVSPCVLWKQSLVCIVHMCVQLLLTGKGASGCAEALICLHKPDRSRVGALMRDLAVAVARIHDMLCRCTKSHGGSQDSWALVFPVPTR